MKKKTGGRLGGAEVAEKGSSRRAPGAPGGGDVAAVKTVTAGIVGEPVTESEVRSGPDS